MIKRILGWLFVFALLGAFAFFGFNWAFSYIIHTRPIITLPDVRYKTLEEAVMILSAMNVPVVVDEEESLEVPKGAVIRQNPKPNSKVRQGRLVRITISTGGEKIAVPMITGFDLTTAQITLRQKGLDIGRIEERYSLFYDKDVVISQFPQPATPLKKGSKVNVVISLGSPPENITLMPDFVNKRYEEFLLWAVNRRVKYKIELEAGTPHPPGTVIGQFPQPDSELTHDSLVKIFVSTGPQ
ncbi:MAG: PASTA domain-containing protein [bacterium]|nr:PASTA domain-containing protein [bacterium]